MPLVTDPARANWRCSGADWEPTDAAWRFASPTERRVYYQKLGELGKQAKDWELIRGTDVHGKRFVRVKPASRPDGATGPALTPHAAESRFRRLFGFVATDKSVTFFWRSGWARIVKYHAYQMGPRALPVRDAVGFSPGRQRWMREGARLWWANKHRLIFPPPATAAPPRAARPAGPRPYGPSRARVRHLDYDPADVAAATRRLFGRAVTPGELASAVGAPDDAIVDLAPGDDDIRISLRGPGYEAARTIRRAATSGKLVIENEYFTVDADRQGQGLGAAVFGRQVEQAARLGVDAIETVAAAGKGYNGYYTWPRFGYDGPLPYAVRARIEAGLLAPPHPAQRVSDLMATAEGRAWWKEHGATVDLTFDLHPGSISRTIWDLYRREKGR